MHGTSYELSQQIMRIFFWSGASKGESQGRQGVTQPFFELHSPDFAWKLVWILLTNFEEHANFQKKEKKCKNVKSTKKLT